MNTQPLVNIYRINLKIKKYERVLIFTDTIREDEAIPESEKSRRNALPDVAKNLEEIGRTFCKEVLYAEYPATGVHGMEPPEKIWRLAFGDKAIDNLKKIELFDKLLNKNISRKQLLDAKKILKEHCRNAVNAVIALSNFSTSHTNFRDLLTKLCGARYASMPLFDVSMLEGAMCADWIKLNKKGVAIKKILDSISKLLLETPNGTEVVLFKGKRKVHIDSGILSRKGSFGNLPAGEVFFAPVEGSAEGKLVIEWAPTRKLNSPLILNVKHGKVTSIEGNEPYRRELEEKLNKTAENKNIAELGVGINDRATKPDNILESEKILGTVHIALGDNSSFGGKIRTPFHQDFIFFKPTLYCIDENGEKIKILEKGNLLV
ncbi:aminopeptidase [Thermodesulfovibrio sp. 3907-1M]|uniref:Aminopeptidase n=1 Tax=Thermodesulfovibrio autotrophicus TaxID=3118333 RepID=A0AAU8GXC8_9BACT